MSRTVARPCARTDDLANGSAFVNVRWLREFNGAFDRSFGMVAFVLKRQLIGHMLRVGRELTLDDYESMLIWGMLAHQYVAHLLPPGALPSVVIDDHGRLGVAAEGKRALRLRDLVQITRLPRETVRRMLA